MKKITLNILAGLLAGRGDDAGRVCRLHRRRTDQVEGRYRQGQPDGEVMPASR